MKVYSNPDAYKRYRDNLKDILKGNNQRHPEHPRYRIISVEKIYAELDLNDFPKDEWSYLLDYFIGKLESEKYLDKNFTKFYDDNTMLQYFFAPDAI